MAKNNHPRQNRHDSPPHGNGSNTHPNGKWHPKPKPANPNPPSPLEWEFRSPHFRPTRPAEGGFKEPRYPSRDKPFGIQNPSRVEKPKTPRDRDRTFQGAGWRQRSPDEPFPKEGDSATHQPRNADDALDNIIHQTRPRTRSQTQLENSQPPNPFNQPISNPNATPWGIGNANSPFQNSRSRSQPQSGYRQPTVEDGKETESDQQHNGNGQKLSPSNSVVMEDAPEISPKTETVKIVHWVDNLSGSFGAGRPGVKAPAKPSFSHYPPLPKNPSSPQSVPPTSETQTPRQPPVFGVTSGYPTPSPTPPPLGPTAVGDTLFVDPAAQTSDLPGSSQHCSCKSPRCTRDNGSSTPSGPASLPKTSHTSGVASAPHTQVPSPPNTPRRSPRFQNPQSASELHRDSSLSNPVVRAECDYLDSGNFNPRMIRPITDLSQIFTSLMGTFGEPGTGALQSRYVQPPSQFDHFRPGFAGVTKNRTYQGRQYSINPSMKSRRVEVELLRTRIPHAVFLQLDLADDARRDALNIGGLAEFAVGTDLSPSGLSHSRVTGTNGTGRPTMRASRAGTNLLSGRSGSRKRNSDPDAWRNVDGKLIRRRESDEDSKKRNRIINMKKAIARGIEQGNPRAIADADYIGGKTSTVNTIIWRFVRLSAFVEMDVMILGRTRSEKTEELQSAWWAVPERSIIGDNF